jgi:hypothetical protein
MDPSSVQSRPHTLGRLPNSPGAQGVPGYRRYSRSGQEPGASYGNFAAAARSTSSAVSKQSPSRAEPPTCSSRANALRTRQPPAVPRDEHRAPVLLRGRDVYVSEDHRHITRGHVPHRPDGPALECQAAAARLPVQAGELRGSTGRQQRLICAQLLPCTARRPTEPSRRTGIRRPSASITPGGRGWPAASARVSVSAAGGL